MKRSYLTSSGRDADQPGYMGTPASMMIIRGTRTGTVKLNNDLQVLKPLKNCCETPSLLILWMLRRNLRRILLGNHNSLIFAFLQDLEMPLMSSASDVVKPMAGDTEKS